jgi:adenylate cyclase
VIARNSSFAYKGKSINVQQVGKELGVRYVLEGSVQKAGDRVRITIQLIDTTTGYHLWSENYDRDLSDIFALQDEITIKIMDAMLLKLTYGEQARLWAGATSNIQAYDKYMQASDYFLRLNDKDIRQAQQLFMEAINLDNTFVWPLTFLGFTHMFELIYRWSNSPIKSFQEAERCAENALALNDSFDVAHTLLGWIYLFKRQHEKAIREGEIAIKLNPNGAEAHAQLAFILCLSDETELAIKLIKRAIRLNPIPPPHYYYFLAMAHRNNEQYEKAIQWSKKALINNPDQLSAYTTLVACYSSLNFSEETRNAVEEVLRINPNFSLEYYANVIPYKNQETADRFIGALRKAGLPE